MISVAERTFCVFLLLLACSIGYFTSLYIVYYSLSHSKNRSSFNTICTYKCCLNLLVLSVFLFWIAPLIITGSRSTDEGMIGIIHRGCFIIWTQLYELLLHLALVLSINRFIAILLWKYYERLFNPKIITIILIALALYAGYGSYKTSETREVYRGDIMAWEMLTPPTDEIVNIVFYVISASCFLNLVTLIYVIANVVIWRTSSASPSKRVLENSKLFVQAFLQDIFFVVDICFLYYLFPLSDNNIYLFICNNYTGILIHALDGPIMLIFQPHMLRPLKRKLGKQNNNMPISSWATPRRTQTTVE